MKIYLSPQFTLENNNIDYIFKNDAIHVKMCYENKTYQESYDFMNVPDGELMIRDNEGNLTFETSLPVNVLLKVKKTDGILKVKLLNWISSKETETEVLFPDWINTSHYRKEDDNYGHE